MLRFSPDPLLPADHLLNDREARERIEVRATGEEKLPLGLHRQRAIGWRFAVHRNERQGAAYSASLARESDASCS